MAEGSFAVSRLAIPLDTNDHHRPQSSPVLIYRSEGSVGSVGLVGSSGAEDGSGSLGGAWDHQFEVAAQIFFGCRIQCVREPARPVVAPTDLGLAGKAVEDGLHTQVGPTQHCPARGSHCRVKVIHHWTDTRPPSEVVIALATSTRAGRTVDPVSQLAAREPSWTSILVTQQCSNSSVVGQVPRAHHFWPLRSS